MEKAFHYIVREPKEHTGKSPLVIMLHGYGSHEEDLFALSVYFPDNYRIVSVRAPYSLDFGGFAWFGLQYDSGGNISGDREQALLSGRKLYDFIDYIREKYQADLQDTFLLGFSQGAILSYYLALNFPDKVKNVVALSGYIWEEIIERLPDEEHSTLRFFCAHGIDDEIIPVQRAREIEAFLQNYHVSFVYREYPVGHSLHQNTIRDFIAWMNRNE